MIDLFNYEGKEGYFGIHGGAFLPEILMPTILELQEQFRLAKNDDAFWNEFVALMQNYSGRPTPVTYLNRLSEALNGAKIYVKREDLNHTGSHKINNVMGQGLLAKRMKKTRVIAETGAGQHGFATAIMAAKLGLECVIYMGEKDVKRQRPNVFWMEKLGAKVVPVCDGQRTLKDAINEAMRDWVSNMDNTHYVLGTACGPHPFPEMVSYFQSLIGKEAKEQLQAQNIVIKRVYSCVGGGSNAMGVFQGFLNDKDVELIACEGGGLGNKLGQHASRLAIDGASLGVVQGYKSYFLQDDDGNMLQTKSISAGLDYVGVSPILAHLSDIGRVRFEAVEDSDVIDSLQLVMQKEGLIPALESSHAFAQAIQEAPDLSKDDCILINQSGRADKDIFTIADATGDLKWQEFIKEKAKFYES